MPYQVNTFNQGSPVSADILSKMNNNDIELYQTYYERARGLVGSSDMIPVSSVLKKTDITGRNHVVLIEMGLTCYPDKYYLVESRVGRVQITGPPSATFSIYIDKIQKNFTKLLNTNTSTGASDCFGGSNMSYIWTSPSTLSSSGTIVNFQLVTWSTSATGTYQIWSDIGAVAAPNDVGVVTLNVIDLGFVARQDLIV